ncbi:hypothetical protein HDU99_005117, partial [Rhizoclosmatium hyalinum]
MQWSSSYIYPQMSLTARLSDLKQALDSDLITIDEFEAQKKLILASIVGTSVAVLNDKGQENNDASTLLSVKNKYRGEVATTRMEDMVKARKASAAAAGSAAKGKIESIPILFSCKFFMYDGKLKQFKDLRDT